jgi:hypothetical protein
MPNRNLQRHAAAEGVAKQVGFRETEVLNQRRDVVSHEPVPWVS